MESSKIVDLSPKKDPMMGIEFVSVESGERFTIRVQDRFPDMGEQHLEGRRYVEVSVEMFIQLMDSHGYRPVVPGGGPTVGSSVE